MLEELLATATGHIQLQRISEVILTDTAHVSVKDSGRVYGVMT